MQFKDYYRILDLDNDATEAEIKRAYRRLARRYHPDVSKVKDAEERFKEVAEAYETLKDPVKRIAYDRFGDVYCGSECGAPLDWERQFGEFFSRDEPTADCGLDALFALLRDAPCPGAFKDASAHREPEIIAAITLEEAAGGTECLVELTDPKAAHCAKRRVRARIPRGATHGQKIRVPFTAGGHGSSDGELTVTIVLKPHPLFRPDGHDLMLDLPITPWEAALGASLEVPTLDGRVRLRIPPGTASNRKLRLPGRGLPKIDGSAGDLYVRLEIVTPSELSDREKQLFTELARASTFEPRARFA